LTVLFCDLVGSTTIADRLDPEDYRELVNGYHTLVAREVDRFGGRIAQYLGDGVLIYFGHPVAHEDDADRAVRAAQHIVDRVASSRTHRYSVRAGLHTGRVVVGSIGAGDHQESLALGPTPNVAARLQQLANPNTVVVSAATLRLLKEGFSVTDLGEQTLRGMTAPMSVYRVDGIDGAVGGLGDRRSLEGRPMVDRIPQKAQLESAWEQVEGGAAVGVVLEGEAGIGKSRLAQWFLQQRGGAARFVSRCSARHEHSGLYPLIELLRFELGLERAASERRVREAVSVEVSGLSSDDPFVVPLLTALLSSTLPGTEVSELSAALRRRIVHDFFRRWLMAKAGERPILLLVDDVHWADPSTLDWLVDFTTTASSAGCMLLLTTRPGFEWPLNARELWHSVEIDRLPASFVQEMLETLGADQSLDQETQRVLLEKTDGVPLFVEELTHMLVERGGSGEMGSGIPSSLEDLLMARLDRIGPARVTAQWAASIGRTFSVNLLREAVPYGAERLEGDLDVLVDRGIVEPGDEDGTARFRHALIQDAAYHALLRSERRQFHGRIAEVLEVSGARGVAGRPEQLARHYRDAGEMELAARDYWKAGSLALARSDNREAIALLRESLECLRETPPGSQRSSRELQCYVALGAALVAVKGYGAKEVSEVHAAAHELSHQIRDGREMFVALRSTLPYYLVRSQMSAALRVGEELVETAKSLADDGLLLEAHTSVATPCFWIGDVRRAKAEAETALRLYDRDRHGGHAARFGQDPAVLCLIYKAWSCWWLGEIEEAVVSARESVASARTSGHKHTLAMALDHAGSLSLYLRDHETARGLIDEALAVAREYGFAMWIAMGTFRAAWLDCVEGRVHAGIGQMQASLEAFRRTGAEIARPLHLSYLAEAYAADGQIRSGLDAVDEALRAAAGSGELHHEPELHRLRGVLLYEEAPERALESLGQAVAMARDRGALSLELRSATSLVRRTPAATRSESLDRLRAVVERFPTAVETHDLREARDELGKC